MTNILMFGATYEYPFESWLDVQRQCTHAGGVCGNACALAQEAAKSQPDAIVLDTVVDREKVARDIKNTASSVTVISAKEIDKEKTGDSSVAEVIANVPNVIYTDNVGAPIIRGQDTQGPKHRAERVLDGTVPRATINLDGHYLNYNEYYFGATSVWDLDIEVFRGPRLHPSGCECNCRCDHREHQGPGIHT